MVIHGVYRLRYTGKRVESRGFVDPCRPPLALQATPAETRPAHGGRVSAVGQNSAWPGVRGYGIASRMLDNPHT